jgi:hypothetical protein
MQCLEIASRHAERLIEWPALPDSVGRSISRLTVKGLS